MASHSRHLHAAGRTWRGDTCWLPYTVNVEQRKAELWLCSAPTRPSDAPCKAAQESTATCMCLRRCSLQDQLDRQSGGHTDSELVLWQTPRSLGPQPIFYHPPVGGSGKPGPQPPSGSQSIEAPGSACQTAEPHKRGGGGHAHCFTWALLTVDKGQMVKPPTCKRGD